MNELEILRRKLAREKAARKQAEQILEKKSLELYRANQELIKIRDRQQQQIQDSDQKYRYMVENASDLISTCTPEGKFLYVNPKCIQLSEYNEEELMSMSFHRLIERKYVKRVSSFYEFQLNEKVPSTYIEFPIVTKSGDEIWIGQSTNLSKIDGEYVLNFVGRDISDRKRVEKALMISEERYRSIIENMELGLLEVNRDGKVIKAYPKFCSLTGFSNQEMIGKDPIDLLLFDEDRPQMKQRNQDRIHGESEVYEAKLRKKDGDPVWVLISGAPYYDEKGKMCGSIGIHLDISQQKELEVELRNAKMLAEESLKTKDLFLANISHEIRTPLNAIIGISELMLESELSVTQREYLKTIMSSGDSLLRLINDILDLSQVRSGKLMLQHEPTELYTVVDDMRRTFGVVAEKKGIDYIVSSEVEELIYYKIDPTRFKEVLFNLLGNAIKFTNKGKVHLQVKKQLSKGNIDYFSFEVIDTGIGIPKEDLEIVFGNFEQASNNSRVTHGGTGLGLSISKEIIERMGGTLSLESRLGKGSRFFFSLKLERVTVQVEDAHKSEEIRDNAFEGYHILLVDDAEVNRLLVERNLDNWGCQVTSAVDGAEAVEFMKENSYDLVLMDIRMPIMNGLEATQIIRKELKQTEVPIIALTANVGKGEIRRFGKVGMDGYVSKPFKQTELFETLKKFFEFVPMVLDQSARFSLVNQQGIEEMTQGDKDFQKHILGIFIEETRERIEQFHEHIESEDEEGIMRTAHAIKPGVAHICATEVLELVRKIELEECGFEQRSTYVKELIPTLEQVILEVKESFSI